MLREKMLSFSPPRKCTTVYKRVTIPYDDDESCDEFEEVNSEATDTVDADSTEKPYKVVVDRPIFVTSADDTGSLQTCDESEDQAVSEFLIKSCCHLKCTEKFSKDVINLSPVCQRAELLQ